MSNSRIIKRQEEILQVLTEDGLVAVSTLAKQLGVSGWTVRRDLERMAREGIVKRQHGLALLATPYPVPPFDSFEKRSREDLVTKRRIGRVAAQLLKPNQYVVIGAGTTTTHVARELASLDHKPMHITTNALNIAMELALCPNLQVTCTGGDVRSDHYTLTGPVAERALRSHYYDVAVIGVSGLTEREGLTVNNQLDCIALQLMIEQSRRLIVVIDSSKIGRVNYVHLAPLDRIDVLVTDRAAPSAFCRILSENGVEIISVESE